VQPAAWTALSNVYSDQGAFLYDVSLNHCPDLLILDDLIQTAQRMLVAGIGDALAKWYEASVSSGHSEQTLIIAAVQQARVLRDILFQISRRAQRTGKRSLRSRGCNGFAWELLGGLGGSVPCAAHAVHNGLTHLPIHSSIHGERLRME